jgi:hypothetical protein
MKGDFPNKYFSKISPTPSFLKRGFQNTNFFVADPIDNLNQE